VPLGVFVRQKAEIGLHTPPVPGSERLSRAAGE
jgi:hypothetical protein